MSDINNNININVQAQYATLTSLMTTLEEAKNLFGSLSKARINFDIKKDISKSLEPLRSATEWLDMALSNVAEKQRNLMKATISGSAKAIEKAKKELEVATQNAKDVIKSIEHTKAIATAKQNVTEDYGQYQAQKLAERNLIEEETNKTKNAMASLSAFEMSLDPAREKAYNLGVALASAREEFIRLNKSGLDTKRVERVIKRLLKLIKELEEATKKTSNSWKVLLNRIKNIAIYRTIRTALHSVMQTITTGFERVTKLNKEAEQSALRLKVDYNLMATAIGSIGYTLLQSLIGPMDSATDSLLEFLNSFNEVLALSLGSDKYLKVVRKGIDGISQSTKKLSFDKFETLAQQDETTLGVGTEEVSLIDKKVEDLNNSQQTLYEILKSVRVVIGDIVELAKSLFTNVIQKILNSKILLFLVNLVGSVITFLEKINLLSTAIYSLIILWTGSKILEFTKSVTSGFKSLWGIIQKLPQKFQEWTVQCKLADKEGKVLNMTWKSLAVAGAAIVLSVVSLIKNWDNMSSSSKGWVIAIAVLTGALAALAFAVYASMHQWSKAISVAAGVVTAGTTVMTAISGFRDGGIPEKSELFYMNENGVPEALVNTGSNNTNVINITQLSQGMKQGFVEAIYETGLIDAMQNRIVIEGDNVNDNAFARAIFPALKTESIRRGGNQL